MMSFQTVKSKLKCFLSDMRMTLWPTSGAFSKVYEKSAIVCEGVLSPNLCTSLIAEIDSVIDQGKNQWSDSLDSDQRIFGFEKYIPHLLPELEIDEVLTGVSKYLGSKVSHWFIMANKVTFVPGNVGSGGGFHRDSVYSNQLKVIWYLNDVAVENGPFSYVEGSHKNLFAPSSPLLPPANRCNTVPGNLKVFTGSAGARLVCDTRCVHGGLPIEEGVRYAITLYTFTNFARYRNLSKKLGFVN